VLNSQYVDEIWLVPTGRHRFKHTQTSAEHRKAMVEIMRASVFGATPSVQINTTEIDRSAVPSTSIELVTHLRAAHPDCEFALIIGSDLIDQIPSWARGQELLATTTFLVVPRSGCAIPDVLPPTMRLVPTDYHA